MTSLRATEVYRMTVEHVIGPNRSRSVIRWYVRLDIFGDDKVLAISADTAERLIASGVRQGPDQ